MKEIIVGDIHGEYDKLDELLKLADFDMSNDKIVFVGDYTDRGEKSFEVVNYLMKLKDIMRDRCILVLGNHEQMMLDYYDNRNKLWARNGCETTINSFKKNDFNPKIWHDFVIANCPISYKGENYNVAHASMSNDKEDMIWDRNQFMCNWYVGDLTFIGHTPVKNPCSSSGTVYEYDKKYNIPKTGLINIDTAAVYGLKLTACVIEDGKMEFRGVH